jgi:hypothetical protein
MVENIAWNESDRMTLVEVVNAQYGNWDFYTYGFAFVDFMYNNRRDLYLDNTNIEYKESSEHTLFSISGSLPIEMGNDINEARIKINTYLNKGHD